MQSSYAVLSDVRASIDPIGTPASKGSPTGVVDRWRVETATYEYRVLDRTEQELLVWHYQPGAGFHGPDDPHLHVSAAVQLRTPAGSTDLWPLDKVHLPTGFVTLADVIRLLIEEFGAAARPDWPERLMWAEGGRPIG